MAYDKIEDVAGNFVIAPENAPWCLNGFRKAKKCIWWLSVAYNHVNKGTMKERLVHLKRKTLKQNVDNYRNVDFNLRNCWHLCGSKYAYLEVRNRFPKSVVEYMVEPISLDFLLMDNSNVSQERESIVLYNPAKPSKRMSELLVRGKFNYVPLEGLAPIGLAEMYKKSKLYVDFGEFGGPERMPKEAVYFGCNILVAKHNAASNDFDVAIPEKYKVGDGEDIERVERRIADMLDNYEKQKSDFLPFKTKVENLEKVFCDYIQKVFVN